MQTTPTHSKRGSATFKVALGVFVLVGFVQLMAVGVALTQRAGQEKIVYKEAPPIILRDIVSEVKDPVASVGKVRSADEIVKHFHPDGTAGWDKNSFDIEDNPDGGDVDITGTSKSYVIRNPLVAKLIEESKDAYLQGDMAVAAMKAEEARGLDMKEPAAAYQLAKIAEDMGAVKRAKSLYLEVFQMGYGAGDYYKRAALKIQNGVGKKMSAGSVMMLGAVHIERKGEGSGARLTIPIRSKKGEEIVADLVEVQVQFYDRSNGVKIVAAEDTAVLKSIWRSEQVDWDARGEEVLDVRYAIKERDLAEQQLFGERKYFGQVIELYYKGELQDVVAHPRILHKIHAQKFEEPGGLLPPIDGIDDEMEEDLLLPLNPDALPGT